MWTIIKFDKKKAFNVGILLKILEMMLFYNSKILTQKYIKNKLVGKEFNFLGDYLFCFIKKFNNPQTIKDLKFCQGLKYFLNGFPQSQNEIKNFLDKFRESENKDGQINQNLFQEKINKYYRFSSGSFTNTIFKIIDLQKNKIDIFICNLKTKINKIFFLHYPV